MTDLTDQDFEVAREFIAHVRKYQAVTGPNAVTAVRVLEALMPAPAPTLAEELAAPLAGRPSAEHVVFDADSVCRLADRAKQMEQELKEARAEVARLRATHPNVEGTRHGYEIRHTKRKDQE